MGRASRFLTGGGVGGWAGGSPLASAASAVRFLLNDFHPVLNGFAGSLEFRGSLGDVEFALMNFGDHLAHGQLVLLHPQLIQ